MGADIADAIGVTVHLTPRGGRDAIESIDADGVIRARVAAPPADGAANEALIKLISRRAGVPRSAIELVGGARSRNKRFRITGIDASSLRARLTD